MELTELRQKMDEVDEALVALLTRRMDIAQEIGAWKQREGLPALDERRERQKLKTVTENAREDMAEPLRMVYSLLFELSRARQDAMLRPHAEALDAIRQAIAETPQLFPETAQVACQGTEGAYAEAACERMFDRPAITYCKTFAGVFSAISAGLCDYGVLPIENSTAGSVKQVYDALMAQGCYIVRSTRIKVRHALLAKPGVTIEEIREVLSHEQALSQCQTNLAALPEVRIHPANNTAEAARLVAEGERRDLAALASRSCAALYGLNVLQDDFQDSDNNYTRFLCIARRPEIYPGANKTTLMLTLPHRPGALYRVLSRLYCLGLNVQKLESRPIPNRDFEFQFCLDIEASIYSDKFERMMRELGEVCEELHYLGSYMEVV